HTHASLYVQLLPSHSFWTEIWLFALPGLSFWSISPGHLTGLSARPLRAAKKVGFPPDSNRERKGQTLKQEAGLYHSAIGAPDMHSQNSMQDPNIFNFGAKIRAGPVLTNTLTQKIT
ncbi:hypothetical protein PROFUN_11287, partial [Planoprotostelium fungivorum]